MKNIILLHGAIGAGDQLQPLANELNAMGFTSHIFNFSGHGPVPFGNQFGIETFAAELEEFILKNEFKNIPVFGYSMGGYVALCLAAMRPDLLGNIITLGTKFAWSPDIAAKEIKMLDPKTIIGKVPKFAEALEKRHGNKWQQLLSKTANLMIELGNANLLADSLFYNIPNKVAIGLAGNDNMVSIEETDRAANAIPNAIRFTLQNTKHPIETVDVKELAVKIETFLN